MNKRKVVLIILGLILAFYLGCSAWSQYEERREQEREKSKQEEIQRLKVYFEENYGYTIDAFWDYVPQGMSVAPDTDVNYSGERYILHPVNVPYDFGPYYEQYIYFTRKEAEKAYEKIADENKEYYCIVSKSLFVAAVDGPNKEMFEAADQYFSNSDD